MRTAVSRARPARSLTVAPTPLAPALAALLLAGCGNVSNEYEVIESPPPAGLVTGAPTTVGFRADVLGASRELPVSVGSDTINGATVTLSGTLHAATPGWIVLDDPATGRRHWIRTESLNWLRQQIPAQTTDQTQPQNPTGS